MTSFNKAQFLNQFASFTPKNEWEEKFSKSLHKQVEKLGKELTEKQVECWNKLIAPKVVVKVETLSEESLGLLTKANNVLIYAQETKDIEFAKSLKSQILEGKSLSSKQAYFLSLIEKRLTPKVEEAPKVEAPKTAKTPKAKTAKVEAPKVEAPKTPKAKKEVVSLPF